MGPREVVTDVEHPVFEHPDFERPDFEHPVRPGTRPTPAIRPSNALVR
jgi:hypothetical protein